ncbi:MAG TPA: SsrA-binding protein SmpB [Spirochaetota bacterium]|nr:SsrA-binding protein SmpB [Spirochaetota bacterium]
MGIKVVTSNKKIHFEYEILDTIEAGIVLLGTEVKSIRFGKGSISEGYVIEESGELFIKNMNIPQYDKGNINNHEPLRVRKLLLNKKEIIKLSKQIKEKGITIVPAKLYFKNSTIKLELAICKGKKLYDKRETIKDRENKRTIEREMKKSVRS